MSTGTLAPLPEAPETAHEVAARQRAVRSLPLFQGDIVKRALLEAFIKLDPRYMIRKPVIFVVYIGSIWSTVLFLRDVGHAGAADNVFLGLVVLWLWFTVLFATFADAMAEGRGKAQAATLRKARQETQQSATRRLRKMPRDRLQLRCQGCRHERDADAFLREKQPAPLS